MRTVAPRATHAGVVRKERDTRDPPFGCVTLGPPASSSAAAEEKLGRQTTSARRPEESLFAGDSGCLGLRLGSNGLPLHRLGFGQRGRSNPRRSVFLLDHAHAPRGSRPPALSLLPHRSN